MVEDFAEEPGVAFAPGEDRLLHVADVEKTPTPRGVLDHLVDQVFQDGPLAEARILEFIEQPMIDLGIETEIDEEPALVRGLARERPDAPVRTRLEQPLHVPEGEP